MVMQIYKLQFAMLIYEPFLPLIGDNINATGSITGVINMTGATQNPNG